MGGWERVAVGLGGRTGAGRARRCVQHYLRLKTEEMEISEMNWAKKQSSHAHVTRQS
jgi:hypothetical protein